MLQSDPNTQHVAPALAAMECVVVQDLFLNETAQLRACVPAGLDLPREERHLHQCRAPHPDGAQGDGAAERAMRTGRSRCMLSDALGYPMHYEHPSQIMDEIARLTPTFAGVSFDKLDELGSVQWPCNDEGAGRHADHAHRRLRARQGQVRHHRICGDRREDRPALPAAAHHRTHPVAIQCRRADAAHRATWCGTRRTGSRSIRTTPSSAACATATG